VKNHDSIEKFLRVIGAFILFPKGASDEPNVTRDLTKERGVE